MPGGRGTVVRFRTRQTRTVDGGAPDGCVRLAVGASPGGQRGLPPDGIRPARR